jgi:phosphoribosylanthranilate isomerase
MAGAARVRIKICCIMSEREARLAVAHGADALGLVGEMPSGPGVIDEALIARIAAQAPPPVATFLLTSRQTVAGIVEQHRRARTTAVQICDRLPEGGHAELRLLLPGVKLVQVIHVTGPAAVEEAIAVAPLVDALLLDSGNQAAEVKELGGTGRAHDWSLSRRICERSDAPVFLAGGLRPDNVGRALDEVRPFGLDVCTGVRSDGVLDPAKLDAFVRAVATATRLAR